MQTLTINDTLAERLAALVRSTGKTEEQVILHALENTYSDLRPIPELSPEIMAAFAEISTSDKFSDAAIMQRYGMKEL